MSFNLISLQMSWIFHQTTVNRFKQWLIDMMIVQLREKCTQKSTRGLYDSLTGGSLNLQRVTQTNFKV